MGMTHKEKKDRLSPTQQRFVEEYIKDPTDGGEAYMRAATNCTNKKSASAQASKLLKVPKVQAELERLAEDTLGAKKVAILKNLDFWLDMRDDPKNSGQIRMKASENLGKYMQMFVEKKEISADVAVKIVDDI
jgi:hypothetical protein